MFSFVSEDDTEADFFFCDHVFQDLFELVVNELSGPLGLSQDECISIRRTARECVQKMPRRVSVSKTGRVGELEVRWTRNDNALIAQKYSANVHYQVILHKKSTCERKAELLSFDFGQFLCAMISTTTYRLCRYAQPDHIPWPHD